MKFLRKVIRSFCLQKTLPAIQNCFLLPTIWQKENAWQSTNDDFWIHTDTSLLARFAQFAILFFLHIKFQLDGIQKVSWCSFHSFSIPIACELLPCNLEAVLQGFSLKAAAAVLAVVFASCMCYSYHQSVQEEVVLCASVWVAGNGNIPFSY